MTSPTLALGTYAGGASTTTLDLARPGEVFPDRLNTVDMRFTKIVKIGRTHLQDAVPLTLGRGGFGVALLERAGPSTAGQGTSIEPSKAFRSSLHTPLACSRTSTSP